MENNEKLQLVLQRSFPDSLKKQGDFVSRVLIKLTKKYIESQILDIGAGSGALINELKSKNYNAAGIDLFPRSNEIQKGSITNLEFKDDGFNTIFCTEVIEHLTDKQIDKGLVEVKRVLRKDGYFIVTVPFGENLEMNTYTCPECGHRFHKVGHLQSFNKGRIKNLLEEHGFEIVFMKVYALGAMSKLPLGRYFNFLFKRLDYESIGKTLVVVAKDC
jgi:ubiquinone/menaquinone biosynthesis C-methylase UbiE